MAVGSKAIAAVKQTFNSNGIEEVAEFKCLGLIVKTIRKPVHDMLTDEYLYLCDQAWYMVFYKGSDLSSQFL